MLLYGVVNKDECAAVDQDERPLLFRTESAARKFRLEKGEKVQVFELMGSRVREEGRSGKMKKGASSQIFGEQVKTAIAPPGRLAERCLETRCRSKRGETVPKRDRAFCMKMLANYPDWYSETDRDVFNRTAPFGSTARR